MSNPSQPSAAASPPPPGDDAQAAPFQTWLCVVCGWLYDEAKGSPEDGIAPGTRWKDLPADWACPECGAGKDDFEMVPV